MRGKKLIAIAIIVVMFMSSACSTTSGVRRTRHIDTSKGDSTVVLVVEETYEEETVYPWRIVFGVLSVLVTIAYANANK